MSVIKQRMQLNLLTESLGVIYWTHDDKNKENIISLHKSLVQPHREYCIQAWIPYLQKDIHNIECSNESHSHDKEDFTFAIRTETDNDKARARRGEVHYS